MPIGIVEWFDPTAGEGRVVRGARRYAIQRDEVERAARVPRARVHFDIRREGRLLRAVNVTLLEGTRVSRRQGRFGDLVGAAHPDEKGRAPLTHRHPDRQPALGLPEAVAVRWTEALEEGDVETALRLYAPEARLHTEGRTLAGPREIRGYLEGSPLLGYRPLYVEISGGTRVLIRWRGACWGGSSGRTWLRVLHGEIAEQWVAGSA